MITNAEDARTKVAIARKRMIDGADITSVLLLIEQAASIGDTVVLLPLSEGQALKLEALGFSVHEDDCGNDWAVTW
jgi:hypothetical protein